MKLIRRSMMCCLLVFLVCTTHVLTSGNAQNQKTSKKDTLERIPHPKMEEVRRIRTAEDWPNPIVVVNSDSFYLTMFVDGERIQEELNLADLKNAQGAKTRPLASGASRRCPGEQSGECGGQQTDLQESQRSRTDVGITQSDDRALAFRLVVQGGSKRLISRAGEMSTKRSIEKRHEQDSRACVPGLA